MSILDDILNGISGLFGLNNNNQEQQTQQSAPAASTSNNDIGRKVSDIEQTLMDIQSGGQDIAANINRTLGLNTDDAGNFDILGTWGDVVDFDENDDGQVDMDRIITTIPRALGAAGQTIGALPGMMVQGWSEAPTYLYSAATGSPISQEGAVDENGNIVADNLDLGERVGSGLYGAINVIPTGLGDIAKRGALSVGTGIAKSAAKAAGKDLASDVVKKEIGEEAGRFASKWAPLSTAADAAQDAAREGNVVKNAAKAAGFRAGAQFLEEGSEEAIQEVSQNELNNRDLTDNVLESFIGGGLAGGTMGALRGTTRAIRNNIEGPIENRSDNNPGEESSSGASTLTPDAATTPVLSSPYYNEGDKSNLLSAVKEETAKDLADVNYEDDATSAMGFGLLNTNNVDHAIVGWRNLENILDAENYIYDATQQRATKASDFFKNFSDTFQNKYGEGNILQQFRRINTDKKEREFYHDLNTWIDSHNKAGEGLDLYIIKNPGGKAGVVKVRLAGIKEDASIGLSQCGAFLLNSDFDSDRYTLSVDNANQYNASRYVSEMLSTANTLSDYKEILAATGMRKENIDDAVKQFENFYNSLGIKSKNLSSAEFSDLARRVLNKKFKVDNAPGISAKLEGLYNNGLDGIYQLVSWALSESQLDSNTKINLLENFLQQLNAFKNQKSSTVENAKSIGRTLADIMTPASEQEGKRTPIKGTVGSNRTVVQTFMERFRRRLYIDSMEGKIACRENLSGYMQIKNQIFMYAASNPGKPLHEIDLIEALLRSDIGCMMFSAHPEDLSTSAIRDMVASKAKTQLDRPIRGMSDWTALEEITKGEYIEARNKFLEMVRVYNQDAYEMLNSDATIIPKWPKDDDIYAQVSKDKIMLSLYGQEDATFLDITQRGDVSYSIESAVELYANNRQNFDLSFDGPSIDFARKMMDRFVKVKKDQNRIAEEQIEKSINANLDAGVKESLDELAQNGYNLDAITNVQDKATITYWCEQAGYWAGRKDFSKAKFFRDVDLIATAREDQGTYGEIARRILSSDTAEVKQGLITLTFNTKFRPLYESMSNVEDTGKIIEEFKKLQEASPLYNAIASYMYNMIYDPETNSFNSDVISSLRNGLLHKLMTNFDTSTINGIIEHIIRSSYLSPILDTEHWFAMAVESKADSLDLQTPLSRLRKAKQWLSRASEMNRVACQSKIKRFFDDSGILQADQGLQQKLLSAMELYAIKNRYKANMDGFVHAASVAEIFTKQIYNKTDTVPGASAIWDMGSVADLGFVPTETQNMAPWVISTEELSTNPQLGSLIFLTDYIKEQGGIRFFLDKTGETTALIKDRYELMSILLGTKITESDFKSGRGVGYFRQLCEKCPALINVIQPVSKAFVSTNSNQSIQYGQGPEQTITDIMEQVQKLSDPLHNPTDTDYGIWTEENIREEIKNEMVAHEIISSRELLSFALGTLDWKNVPDYDDGATRSRILREHIYKKIVPWLRQYMASSLVGKREMLGKLLGRTIDENILETQKNLELMQNFLRNGEPSDNQIIDFDNYLVVSATEDTVKKIRKTIAFSDPVLRDRIDDIAKKSEIAASDRNGKRLPGAKTTFKDLVDKGMFEYVETLNSPGDFYQHEESVKKELDRPSSSFCLMEMQVWWLKAIEANNKTQDTMDVLQKFSSSVMKPLEDLKAQLESSRKALVQWYQDYGQFLKEFKYIRDQIDVRLDYVNNQIDTYDMMLNPSSQSLSLRMANAVSNTGHLNDFVKCFDSSLLELNPPSTSENLIVLSFVDNMKQALDLFTTEHKEDGKYIRFSKDFEGLVALTEEYVREKPNLDSETRSFKRSQIRNSMTKIAGKVLSSICVMNQVSEATPSGFTLQLSSEAFGLTTNAIERVERSNLESRLKEITVNDANASLPTPNLKFHLTDAWGDYQIGNIATAILTGNVGTGVSLNANTRKAYATLALMPDDLSFSTVSESVLQSPDNNLVDCNITKSDLIQRFINQGCFDKDSEGRDNFYGHYREIGPDGTRGEWKAISPQTLCFWADRKNRGELKDGLIDFRSVMGDSVGFEPSAMMPSRDGRAFNQFANILTRLIINSTEPLNLKTSKNPTVFEAVTFVSNVKNHKQKVIERSKKLMGNVERSAQEIYDAAIEVIQNTKKNYREMLDASISNTGRDELELDKKDFNVITNHVVQGAIIKFKDGSSMSVMYRDLLELGPDGITLPVKADGKPLEIASIEAHIFELVELGNVLSDSVIDNYLSSIQNENAESIRYDDMARWKQSFEDSIKNFTIKTASNESLQNGLFDSFSRCITQPIVNRSSFALPNHPKIDYFARDNQSHTGSAALYKQEYLNRIDDLEKETGLRIAQYYGDPEGFVNDADGFKRDAEYTHDSAIKNAESWANHHILVFGDTNNISHILDEAKRKQSFVTFIARTNEEAQSLAQESCNHYGFINWGSTGIKSNYFVGEAFGAVTVVPNNKLDEFMRSRPTASMKQIDPNAIRIVELSSNTTTIDGSLASTAEGYEQTKRTKAETTRSHDIYLSDIDEYANPSYSSLVSYDELKKVQLTRADVINALIKKGMSNAEALRESSQVLDSFKQLKRKSRCNFTDDGIYTGECKSGGNVVVGICKKTVNSVDYYIPIIVNVHTRSRLEVVVSSPEAGGIITFREKTPLLGSRGYADIGTIKVYLPDLGCKTTLNTTDILPSRYVHSSLGSKIGVHDVTNEYWQGGKIDPYLFVPTNYIRDIKIMGLSPWFKYEEEIGKNGKTRLKSDKYQLNMSWFTNWHPDDIITFFTGSKKERLALARRVCNSNDRLSFSIPDGGSYRTVKIMTQIFQNAIEYDFDPFVAISGLELKQSGKDMFKRKDSEEELNLENIVFKRNSDIVHCAEEYTTPFVFDNIDSSITSDVQELFHVIAPKRFRDPAADDSIPLTEEYNQAGQRRIENPDGTSYHAYVFYTEPNYDQTETPLLDPSFGATFGNKQKILNALTYRDVLHGDLAPVMLEAMIERGRGNLAAEELKRLKRERQARLGKTTQEAMQKYSRDVFQSAALKQQDPMVTIEQTLRSRTYDEYFDKWETAVVPLMEYVEGKPQRIDLKQRENSQTMFEDERLNKLKSYMQTHIMNGNTITCKEFLTVLKYATSYAKEKKAENQITFEVNELRELIDNIEHNIEQTECFPFGINPTIRNNKGTFVRYGMPIMKMDVFNIFRNNNERMKEHYKDVSDSEIYTKMINIFDQLMNGNKEKLSKARRRSLFAIAEYEAEGTPMEGNDVFTTTISGLSPMELCEYMEGLDESLLGEVYKDLPELKEIARQQKEKAVKVLERQSKTKKHLYKDALHGRSFRSILRSKGEKEGVSAANYVCSIRRIMSIAGRFMLIPSAIAERFRYATPMKYTLRASLRGKGPLGNIYKNNLNQYLSAEQIDNLLDATAEISKTGEVTNLYGLIKSITAMGDFDWTLNEAASDYNGMAAYLKDKIESGGTTKRVENISYSWASGLNVGAYQQVEIFINDLIRLISLDETLSRAYLANGKESMLIKNLQSDPESFISSCFKADSPLRGIAMQALNTSLQGDAAQRTALSALIEEYCSRYPVLDFFMGTFLCPFVQYGVNATGRALNAVLPVSTFHQVILNALSKSDKKVPGLGEARWSDFNWEDMQTAHSVQEALKLDMLNIGTTGVACLIVGLGCMEPPDDDDKWGNVDEWTFMGQRISVNWWLKDIIGPALGIACAMKSAALGKPNAAVLFNDLSSCMYSNPLVRSSELVGMVANPYEVYQEKYYNDLERYSNMEDSNVSGSEVLFSNLSISAINWLMGFCTPGILKDLYKESQTYEVSHKKIYETDVTGQRTEDSYTEGATQNTTYFDAKLREQTKKNPVLAWLCDMFIPHTTGYFASEMPRTVYYDPAQMDAYKALSLYTTDEYGNKVQKSDEECQAIALGVIIQLQSYGSMEELAKTGFCVPYDTLDYVSDMIWDIANGTTSLYEDYVSSGALDPYVLGDGDYETGTAMAEEIKSTYENTYSYWKSFYYDKLWSDEMKQGLVKYNRYATYYEQDANGEWYANGYRRSLGNIVSPFLVASGAHSDALGIDDHGSNMGYDEDWATQSVVTGMSTGERVLVPRVEDVETPKFESRADDNNNGYSKNYTTTYGSGSRSYGSSGSYKKSSAFNYTAPKNSLSFTTPYANTIDTPKISTTPYKNANFDRLYPSFETQGSRKAYKREDF